jgi:hypothetical protein
MMQSCIVLPDPWREEVYLGVAPPKGIGPNDTSTRFDYVIPIRVYASGYEFDLHSPYGVSIHLVDDGKPVEAVKINAFNMSLNGRDIQGLRLENVRSREAIEYGSDTVELDHAPCCMFYVATTKKLDIEHVPNEILVVTMDVCITVSGKTDCFVVEKLFRAVVRKGFFQMTPV